MLTSGPPVAQQWREQLKQGRRHAHAMAVERKAEDESNFFWMVKTQQLNYHQGRPRQESAAQLARDEKELFSQVREAAAWWKPLWLGGTGDRSCPTPVLSPLILRRSGPRGSISTSTTTSPWKSRGRTRTPRRRSSTSRPWWGEKTPNPIVTGLLAVFSYEIDILGAGGRPTRVPQQEHHADELLQAHAHPAARGPPRAVGP